MTEIRRRRQEENIALVELQSRLPSREIFRNLLEEKKKIIEKVTQ